MSEKVKKPKSKARIITEWVLTIVFGAAFLFAGIAQVDGLIHRDEHFGQTLRFGWGSFVVLTDSMEPEYPVNSAIITYYEKPENIVADFTAGKTVDITFQNGFEYIAEQPSESKYRVNVTTQAVFTHRLFEVREDKSVAIGEGHYLFFVAGINTSGDNWKESQYQVFTERSILGLVKANSPFLGWFFNILSSPWGLLIFLLIPAGYLVVVSVLDIFKGMKDDEEKPAVAGGSAPINPASLEGLSEADKKRLKDQLLEEMLEQKQKGGKQ